MNPSFRHGRISGLGSALQLLRDAGVPLEVQDTIHELIDFEHIELGDLKREPRSKRFKEALDGAL